MPFPPPMLSLPLLSLLPPQSFLLLLLKAMWSGLLCSDDDNDGTESSRLEDEEKTPKACRGIGRANEPEPSTNISVDERLRILLKLASVNRCCLLSTLSDASKFSSFASSPARVPAAEAAAAGMEGSMGEGSVSIADSDR